MNNGKQGEVLFKSMLANRGYQIIDVSDNEEYFSKDIDLIVTSPTTNSTRTFEIKWDSKISKTRNLYLETFNINSKQWNYDGWWKHCKADYLVYGDSVNQIFYIFHLGDLRERVDKLVCRKAYCGNDSEGLLVSLDSVKDLYVVDSPYSFL